MRPRAWPVFAVFAAARITEFAIGVGLVVVATYAWVFAHPQLQGLPDAQLDAALEPLIARLEGGFTFQSILCALTSLCFLTAAVAGAAASGEPPLDALRLRGTPGRPVAAAAAVLGCAAFQRALFAAFRAAGVPPGMSPEWLGHALPGASAVRWAAALVVFAILPGAAIVVFFNGYMQTRLVRCWGKWAGIPAAAGAFALTQATRWGACQAFLLGLFLGWVVERTGNVRWAAAGVMLANAIELLIS